MKLNSKQVAEKLGVKSTGTVTNLVNKGLLKDISGKTNKRHHMLFDSKEVNELKKTYKKHSHSNGFHKPEVIERPSGFMSRLQNIATRISRLEDKVDQLIKIWS